MKRSLLLCALLLAGCAVVPTTNDASAWRQPWVAEERARFRAWQVEQWRLGCDELMLSNMEHGYHPIFHWDGESMKECPR